MQLAGAQTYVYTVLTENCNTGINIALVNCSHLDVGLHQSSRIILFNNVNYYSIPDDLYKSHQRPASVNTLEFLDMLSEIWGYWIFYTIFWIIILLKNHIRYCYISDNDEWLLAPTTNLFVLVKLKFKITTDNYIMIYRFLN